MQKSITLDYYNDQQHGWVKLPFSIAQKIGFPINGDISNHSFVNEKAIYLERHLDTALFLQFCKTNNINITFRDHFSAWSKIRSFKRFEFAAPKPSKSNNKPKYDKETTEIIEQLHKEIDSLNLQCKIDNDVRIGEGKLRNIMKLIYKL